jgi:hypothetical protein
MSRQIRTYNSLLQLTRQTIVDPYNSQCGGGSGPGYWSQAAIGAAIAAVAAAAEMEASTLCTAANGLTPDQTLAVQTVMGENSWYLLGHASYLPGDTRGDPTGPIITASSVFTEDIDMFSVLTNRAAAQNSTIGAVATQPGQFRGYNNSPDGGIAKYNAAINSQQGSSPCNDLMEVVNAMNAISQSGSLLPSNYLYWKAIDQGPYGFHYNQPGDIYVANTAFATINTH